MAGRLTVALIAMLTMAGIVYGDYASYVLSLEPSLYYRLNDTAVGTVVDSSTPAAAAVHSANVLVTDLSQTPGALAPWDSDSFLQSHALAVDLVGVESQLVSGNADFSVSIWVKPADFQAGDWGTYFFMGAAGMNSGFILNESGEGDGRVLPGVYGGNFMPSTDAMVLNQWNHVGFTYDADTVTGRLFVNGKLQYAQDLSVLPTVPNGYTALNIQSGGSALGAIGPVAGPIQPFNGGIDEFAFFQKTLADNEMVGLSVVPEPSTWILTLMAALACLGSLRRHI